MWVCEAMKTGLLLAGLRINFDQRAPLAGFIPPCVAVWDRSGSILLSLSYILDRSYTSRYVYY